MKNVETYTWPHCPYCIRTKELLNQKGIEFTDHDIYGDEAKRDELLAQTGQRTVPFVFIGDKFIGGCSDLQQLDASGELDQLLAD